MGIGIWFWFFLVGALVFGFLPRNETNARYYTWGGNLLWFILFALLGLAVFGGPIKG